MKLDEYVRHQVGGFDPFGLRRFAGNLVAARSTTRRMVEAIERLDRLDRKASPSDLRRAAGLALRVSEFFPRYFHMGKLAYSLYSDLAHLSTRAAAYPGTTLLDFMAPRALLRARRVERYLNTYGAAEIACQIGRARSLHDNGPFLVLFSGASSGLVLATVPIWLQLLPVSLTWLVVFVAVLSGFAVGTQVALAVSAILRGQAFIVSWPIVSLAVVSLPKIYRSRYSEEFKAELLSLSFLGQIGFSFRALTSSLWLRLELRQAERQRKSGRSM